MSKRTTERKPRPQHVDPFVVAINAKIQRRAAERRVQAQLDTDIAEQLARLDGVQDGSE